MDRVFDGAAARRASTALRPTSSRIARRRSETMKARVFVTLKPSVFDPQGKTIADALHSLGYNGVGDVRQGKYFELELAAASAEQARTLAVRSRRQGARQPRDRELSDRDRLSWQRRRPEAGAEHDMKFGVVVFPGSNCDHDAYHAAKDVLGQDAEFIWHKDTAPEGGRRRDPARRLRARRLPAHRRHRAVLADHAGDPRVRRAPAARCSGSATASRSCSRRACCPARCCATATSSSTASTSSSASSRPTRRSRCARRAGSGCGCRSRTAKATTTPTPDVVRELEAARRVIFRYCDARGEVDRRGQPERLGQQHRRHLQRGAQRRRPDAASRARVRGAARQRRRPRAVRVGRRGAGAAQGLAAERPRVANARLVGKLLALSGLVMLASAGRLDAMAAYAEGTLRTLAKVFVVTARRPRDRVLLMSRTDDDRHPRGIRAHRLAAEARAHRDRARHLLRHVVRALQLQELARST